MAGTPVGYSASSSSASDGQSSQDKGGGLNYGSGAFIVNIGGSGTADFASNAAAAMGQPGGGTLPVWAWALLGAGALWLIL